MKNDHTKNTGLALRSIYLKAAVLSVSLPLAMPVFADIDAAFEELDKQVESQYGAKATTAQPKSEFEQWRQQQQAEYQDYKRKYYAALEDYKNAIKRQWGDAEVTDKKRWVEYSDDLQTKRVVDYEKNEIRISVLDPAISDSKLQQLIDANLAKMLQQTPNSAREADPVLKAVGSTKPSSDEQSRLAILQEVIDPSAQGSEQQRFQQSLETLKKQAVIKRPEASASQASASATKNTAPQPSATGKDSGEQKTVSQKPASQPLLITIALPQNSIGRRAARYEALVLQNAGKSQVDPSLVYAIMHTESAFNPMARSHVPAYGLMQIVPESAGLDVSQRLYGEGRLFSADYLFNAGNNVQAGATYINILYYSYLKGIKDPLSRTYCVIAAYNTGAGNVAKSFVGSRKLNKALPLINQLTPAQVYDTLVKKLPYQETREYLKRVVERQKIYSKV
ncbi:murein transglycosylase domain-containing protein [Dasania sp. GY-MA-18]|uniref:Murein transglycosylase domain-containing protein n=1 Tax=Dasania phycosphaerae TaxID=2950436 RepID=A0A9J6RNQ9_9GAMM|nr:MULTISPECIES: murein transglycosylase domain-containing protein [Dasania]MCR8923213.1 murein transglycosylase domain-containing protein [Dasania sp. GY-MA-18]MCZ0865645.1 murein transglycosylase domain-containing protein [Dasania phycosphaerae]MCZ0869370.1 murein transglycosylase domain-containing protein [Dasania phycosphaerae]